MTTSGNANWNLCNDPDTDSSCCDTVYNAYNGQDPILAGLAGAGQGFSSIIGAGGFWKPVNSDSQDSINDSFTSVKNTWDGYIEGAKFQLNEDMNTYNQDQINYVEQTQKQLEETLSEEIAIDGLLISIISVVLIIILIYLLVI